MHGSGSSTQIHCCVVTGIRICQGIIPKNIIRLLTLYFFCSLKRELVQSGRSGKDSLGEISKDNQLEVNRKIQRPLVNFQNPKDYFKGAEAPSGFEEWSVV